MQQQVPKQSEREKINFNWRLIVSTCTWSSLLAFEKTSCFLFNFSKDTALNTTTTVVAMVMVVVTVVM